MKYFLFLLVIVFLQARENPFIPIVTNKNIHLIKKSMLSKEKITFPSDARVLKSVTFTYQTLTGAVLNKTVTINKSINWHSPIYISQKKLILKPKKVKIAFLNFYINSHHILIETSDKMIRHFVLVKPFRLVLDFKANKKFLTYRKTINSFIKKVVIGNHSNFYRVVLYTDGVYKPIIKTTTEGYMIDFK
jgi:hypothetical protein